MHYHINLAETQDYVLFLINYIIISIYFWTHERFHVVKRRALYWSMKVQLMSSTCGPMLKVARRPVRKRRGKRRRERKSHTHQVFHEGENKIRRKAPDSFEFSRSLNFHRRCLVMPLKGKAQEISTSCADVMRLATGQRARSALRTIHPSQS